MTPAEFKSWRKAMGYTQKDAAAALGISVSSVELYERGSRRDDDRPVDIPRRVELACEALRQGNALERETEETALLAPDVVRAAYIPQTRGVGITVKAGRFGFDLQLDIATAQRLRAELERAIAEGIAGGAG